MWSNELPADGSNANIFGRTLSMLLTERGGLLAAAMMVLTL